MQQPSPNPLISPPHSLFTVPELLANILLQLPHPSITICRRVCRFWKETIRVQFPPDRIPLPDSALPTLTCGSFRDRFDLYNPRFAPGGSACRIAHPAILEQILAYLDFTSLLRSQRVSRSWFTLVFQSSILRKNLFLEPTPTPNPQHSRQHPAHHLNPYLLPFFSPQLLSPRYNLNYQDPDYPHARTSHIHRPGEELSSRHLSSSAEIALTFPADKYEELVRQDGCWWRAMLVRQPPARAVEVHFHQGFRYSVGGRYVWEREDGLFRGDTGGEGGGGGGGSPHPYVRVERRAGVRLGDVIDEVRGVVGVDYEGMNGRGCLRDVSLGLVFL